VGTFQKKSIFIHMIYNTQNPGAYSAGLAGMGEKPIKSFDDQRWLDLVEEFNNRVEADNLESPGINSVYLPNPEICPNPDYLLLGMEPGEYREEAEVVTFSHISIHYCAYKYLCNNEFKYYITDLAKGAMSSKKAESTQTKRYSKWRPLFEKEWRLLGTLGTPKIIAMGPTVYNKIKSKFKGIKDKNGNPICDYVYHYTENYQNNTYLRAEYEKYKSELDDYKLDETELREFAEKLKKHLGKYEATIDDSLNATLNNVHRRDIVFPLYSYQFKQVADGKNIPHRKKEENKKTERWFLLND